ncbi:MAG: FtsX-like permease family protein [Proteobacteria bacterium]|nr:FtsX-like permease family protein [Pseudomonadota bacterium]MBU1685754.1 FtsX-like permease family protein [Pseudomonadota bacterium]
MTLIKIALKNLRRKRFRSLSIILAGTLACGLVFTGAVLLKSVKVGLELGMARLGADIMVVPDGYEAKGSNVLLGGEPTAFYMDKQVEEKVAQVPGVQRTSPQLFITSLVVECCTLPTVLLVGFDPGTDFAVTPWIKFKVDEEKMKFDPITVGVNTLYATDGMLISFFGKRFQVKSAAAPTGLRFIDYSAFMTMEVARSMIDISKTKAGLPLEIDENQISTVMVKIDPEADVYKVASTIESSVPGVKTVVSRNLVTTMRQDVEASLWGIVAVGILSWAMTLFLMGLVFAMVVNERQREFGLLRAMGATREKMIRLILYEAAVLAAIGSMIGVIGGMLTLDRLKRLIILIYGTEIPFVWPDPIFISVAALLCGVAIIVSCTSTALGPAIRCSKLEPYEAIREG